MDMKKRRDMQLLYVADEAIMEEQSVCRKKLQKLNFMDRSDFDGVAETVKDLFGKTGKDCMVNPPFYCDSGSHIEVGENFFANYNCMIIDVAKVRIGANCFMAPITTLFPICTPGQTTVFPPIHTLSPMVTSFPYSNMELRVSG